jgi:hypothetical protein
LTSILFPADKIEAQDTPDIGWTPYPSLSKMEEPSVGRRKKDDKRKDKAGMPSAKCARLREAIIANTTDPKPKKKK